MSKMRLEGGFTDPIAQKCNNNFDDLYTLALPSVNKIFVSVTGIATGDGSAGNPVDLQTGLNMLTTGKSLHVGPGLYMGNYIIPDHNLHDCAIIGDAESTTFIRNLAAGHTLSWVPGAVNGALTQEFQMMNLTFQNTDTTGTYHAIHFDGNAITFPNAFMGEELDFVRVDVEGAQAQGTATAYLRNIGNMFWEHGDVSGGDLTVTNPGQFATRMMQIGTLTAPMNLNFDYNGNNPVNGLGRSNETLAQQTVIYGNLVLTGHPIFQMDSTCLVVGNVVGTALTSFYASGRDYCPLLVIGGAIGLVGSTSSVTITFPDPQATGSAFNFLDLSKAEIQGAVTLTKTNFLPATVARGFAYVQGQADFHSGVLTLAGYILADLSSARYAYASAVIAATSIATRDSQAFATVTASRTAVTHDNGALLKCNSASAIAITVNQDAVVGWSTDEKLTLYQYGAGATSFTAGAGVTFRGAAPTPGQYVRTTLQRIGANEWSYT